MLHFLYANLLFIVNLMSLYFFIACSQVIRVLTPVFAVNIPPNPLRWRLFWILLFTAMTYVMQLCLQALRSLLGWAYRNMPPGMLTGGGSTIFMQIRLKGKKFLSQVMVLRHEGLHACARRSSTR
ncbi:Protein POLLEN DEFECTIVE IN GUIDANCE [Arachis hypogaea]|nr:Protein POLLEN DEFECTIVE IN GUIDANCE [Arachis hypogaea]